MAVVNACQHPHRQDPPYVYSSSTDSEETGSQPLVPTRHSFSGHSEFPQPEHLHSLDTRPRYSSATSTANSTPVSSRPPSPQQHVYFPSQPPSPYCSGSESDGETTYLTSFNNRRHTWWREDRRLWWSGPHRGRRKDHWKVVRVCRRWTKRILRFLFNRAHLYTIVRLSSDIVPCSLSQTTICSGFDAHFALYFRSLTHAPADAHPQSR